MRYGLWALAALFVGAFGAHFLLEDRGYVLINYRSYIIEMSVPILAALFALLYVCIRLILRVWRAPRQLGQAIAEHRYKRAGAKLTRGLIHLTEGDFKRGERLLSDGLHGSESKLVNYLMAARAAQLQGSPERRDEWLNRARESEPAAATAVGLTQAELQLASGEPTAALATLERIQEGKADHPGCLALMAKTHLGLQDLVRLKALLPRLAKAKLPPDTLVPLVADSLQAMLKHGDFELETLNTIWSSLSASLRKRPALIRARALLLDKFGKGDEAVKALTSALKRSWDSDLVIAYGEVEASDLLKQLRRAEGWLKHHGEDSVLLMTAARLCMANELWGKARSYLESSIAIAPEPASYSVYGDLLDRLGESDAAARAYHAGLSMVSPNLKKLPALAAPATYQADA